ncbi:MAG: hypothetical protein ABIQ73_30205 [Acidimicrobiales bacterium]
MAVSDRIAGDPTDASDFVAQWQAPDRVRFGETERGQSVIIANKLYSSDEGAPDRFRLTVVRRRRDHRSTGMRTGHHAAVPLR